jgi:hypothetical protein
MRRMVQEQPRLKASMTRRVDAMAGWMREGAVLSAESYPDECWTFDNTNALAAMRIADALDGSDHSELIRDWLNVAREKLIDPATGLLISSYTLDGTRLDGPEGSTIWMTAHALLLLDPVFARDQYDRARRELGHSIAGFGLAREWPRSANATPDIDSGVQRPIVEASPSSSAFAILAASAFEDREFRDALLASLDFAAFPVEDGTGLRYAAGNQVGDAVILYALTQGPVWDRIQKGALR